MELKEHTINGDRFFSAIEIHSVIFNNYRYSDFVKNHITGYAEITEGIEFVVGQRQTSGSKGGRPVTEYYVHIDYAKEILATVRTKESRAYLKYLISLDNETEEGLRPTHLEVLLLIDLIMLFSYHEYREQVRLNHKAVYVSKLANGKEAQGWMFGQFEKWRADALNLGKDILNQRLKEFCIANYAKIPKKITQAEALIIIDKFELIKNAVWDLLMSKNKSEKYIENTCILAKELAIKLQPDFKRWNEQNLFQEKEEVKINLLK